MRAAVTALIAIVGIAACGGDDPPPATGLDAGSSFDAAVPSSMMITAAAGGTIGSSDGVFRLVVPPGALAEDTRVSVSIVPRADWPAEAAAGEPLAGVYSLEPDGLTFLEPAYAVHEWPSAPAGFVTADGYSLAVHYAVAADGTLEPVPTTTVHRLDGHVLTIGAVSHLSSHFAEQHARVRSETRDFSIRVDATGGTHVDGDGWRWTAATFHTTGPVRLMRVTAAAVSWAPRFVVPIGADGASPRTDRGGVLRELRPSDVYSWNELSNPVNADVTAGTFSPLTTPLPGWRCMGTGNDGRVSISASAEVSFGATPRTFYVRLETDIEDVTCAPAAIRDAGPPIDAGPRMNGMSCTGPGDCASGWCADGVCCHERCQETCRGCTASRTGQPDGMCANITYATDPDDECPGMFMCVWATPTGSAICGARIGMPCVDEAFHTDCRSSPVSFVCTENVCCDRLCSTASGRECHACTTANKGYGFDGVCEPVLRGLDPFDECPDATHLFCSGTGVCEPIP